MNYRFEISLPDSSEFRCEIAIAGEQTFQQLHDKIVEVLEYDASQMASFYTIDKMGKRGKEIALMDMSEDEETGTLVMDSTKIEDVINSECIELEYVYDFFDNKYFRVEYAGEYVADSADILPVCVYCDGDIPEQSSFGSGREWDSMFVEAAEMVVSSQQASTSMLQRKFKLGYNRAGRIMDQLESAGVVSAFDGRKIREVKIKDPAALQQILSAIGLGD